MRVDSQEALEKELQAIVGKLNKIHKKLKAVQESLPGQSVARADVECCIHDRLEPLIESLKAIPASPRLKDKQ